MQKESKAIPFIVKQTDKDHYHLTQEAAQFLSTINTPLSVVTVAGMYRTGKSYLLNRVILNRSNGFGVGPTVNPCTKGLWLWAQPIKISQGRTLLVVDTEGLGALDQESNHDMKIFCLAVLLSSNFIYNSVGSIDQPALQTLSLVLNLISNIDKESYSSRPSFLWVVRDFSLQLINDKGENITSKQYLQFALNIEHLKQQQKIQLRKTITEAFSERECFTLVKPLIDQQKLQNLDKISHEQLRAEFISQTIALRKYIFQSLKEVKLNNSTPLRGKDYILMINRYLSALNCGEMPNLLDTWSYIRQEKAIQIMEYLRQSYTQKLKNKLNNRIPLPVNKLQELLVHLRTQTLDQFVKMSYDDSPNEQLKQFLTNSEAEILKINAKEAKNILSEVLKRQFEPFQKKLLSDYYADSNAYQSDLRTAFKTSIHQKYNDRFDIPMAEVELYAERKISEGIKLFEKRARDELNRTRQMRLESQSSLQNEIRGISKTTEQQKRRHQEEIFAFQKKIIILTNQKQKLEQTHAKLKEEDLAEAVKIKRKASEYQGTMETLQQELARFQSQVSEQERTMFMVKRELQKQKALSGQKEEHLSAKINQLQRRNSQLQQQLQRTTKQWQTEKRQITTQFEMKNKQTVKENKQLHDRFNDVKSTLQQERFLKQQLEEQILAMKGKFSEQIQHYRQKITSSNRKQQRRDDNDQLVRQLNETQLVVKKYQEDIKEWETRTKQLNYQVKTLKSNYETTEALSAQKIELQQIQISELKSKNEELNQAYQKCLQSTHQNSKVIDDMYSKKMVDLEAEHQKIFKDMEDQYQRRLKDVKREAQYSAKNAEEMELQLSITRKKAQDKQKELNQSLRSLGKAYEQALKKYSNSQEGYAEVTREKQHYYQSRIKQLQSQIESVKEKAASQSEEHAKKTQEALMVLKNYSAMERTQWQKRLQQQKDKSGRKLKEQQQQFSRKLSEQKQNYETTISQLEQKINAMEQSFGEQFQAMRCDYEIKMQKLSNLALQEKMQLGKKNALLSQQAELTKNNLLKQLQERSKHYQHSLETLKRQLTSECEQQVRAAREAFKQAEIRLDSLKKANRKTEEANLLLKSELDKNKALFNQKQQNYSKRMKELQVKYSEQMRSNSKKVEEMISQHTVESRRLNSEIQKQQLRYTKLYDESNKTQTQHEEMVQALLSKHSYYESKIKRNKDDYEQLLRTFETTAKNAASQNSKAELHRKLQETKSNIIEHFNAKMTQKQEFIQAQRSQNKQKIGRLQAENKSLRDKIISMEINRSTNQTYRYQDSQQIQKLTDKYQKKIYQLEQLLSKEQRENKRFREERESAYENSIRMERSRISQRPERHSVISDLSNIDANSTCRGLNQNKSLLNRRPPAGTSIKKQEKRFQNTQDASGFMRWQQQQ